MSIARDQNSGVPDGTHKSGPWAVPVEWTSSVPNSAQWSQFGHEQPFPHRYRHTEERAMGIFEKPREMRASRSAGTRSARGALSVQSMVLLTLFLLVAKMPRCRNPWVSAHVDTESQRDLDFDPTRRAVQMNNNSIRSGKIIACVLSPPILGNQDSSTAALRIIPWRSLERSRSTCATAAVQQQPGSFAQASQSFTDWKLNVFPESCCHHVQTHGMSSLSSVGRLDTSQLCRYRQVDVIHLTLIG